MFSQKLTVSWSYYCQPGRVNNAINISLLMLFGFVILGCWCFLYLSTHSSDALYLFLKRIIQLSIYGESYLYMPYVEK